MDGCKDIPGHLGPTGMKGVLPRHGANQGCMELGHDLLYGTQDGLTKEMQPPHSLV